MNPSISTVRKFVHLLDVGDNDYTEEFGTETDVSLCLLCLIVEFLETPT